MFNSFFSTCQSRPEDGQPMLGTASASWKTIILSALIGLVTFCGAVIAESTPERARGKEIYLKGIGAGGAEIKALIGDRRLEVPASVMPCVNCHGRDGRGKAEARSIQ